MLARQAMARSDLDVADSADCGSALEMDVEDNGGTRNKAWTHRPKSKAMRAKGKFTALSDDKDENGEEQPARGTQQACDCEMQQQPSSSAGSGHAILRIGPLLLIAAGALLMGIGLLRSHGEASPSFRLSKASQFAASHSAASEGAQRRTNPCPPPLPVPPPPRPPSPLVPPPPLSPEPSMPPGASAVAVLNARWFNGFASNNLSEAGLLLHTFDKVDGDDVRDDVWLPCSDTGYWCAGYEVSSASLINHRLPHWFNEDWAGVVLSPTALSPLSESIRCAFAYDAGTMGDPSGCPGMECDDGFASLAYCHWGSDQLGAMLQQHEELEGSGNDRPCGQSECDYNEVVLDADFWVRALPSVVAAIFFPRDSRDAELRAREVLRSFRERYGSAVADVPLVSIDRESAEEPFVLVDAENCCVSPESRRR